MIRSGTGIAGIVLVVAGAALAGCSGYDPPVAGDHASAKFQGDLGRCRTTAFAKTRQTTGATPQAAIASIFTSNEPEHQDITACMAGKGYAPS